MLLNITFPQITSLHIYVPQSCHSILTLPVRRYLVPTPSCGGGGGGGGWPDPSMILKPLDPTNFNFDKPLGLSIRGKKLVELMI